MVMATTDGYKVGGGTPSISRARLSTSVEPTGMAGTSWNSSRWTRPSSSSYRTGRMATMDAGGSNCSSSIASSSIGVQSPHSSYTLPTTATSFRSSDRAPSAATTTRTHQYDPTAVIRPNSRYGTSFLNSMSSNGSSSTAVTNSSSRPSQSASSNALSPRHEPQRKSYPYRTSGFSQPRSTLIDMRQSLRPVKKQIVTDYSKSMPRSSAAIASAAPIPTTVPLTLFTNARTSSHPSAALSPVSPFAKCVSPPSSTMSRSSSTVTSPVTTPISSIQQRPIPKSERPWRQKLADAQRLRDAQADRTFGHHIPMNEAYDTTARILAARSARRASIEQQQTQKQQNNEQQLEKEIAALKCYVSEPGALDKNATVAKFRQRMAEGQVTASLAPTTSTSKSSSSSSPESATLSNASSLLSRMPSLSRRSTTAVTKDALPKTQESKGKDRPLSMVETPLGERRLSVVCESPTSPTAKMPIGAEGGIAEKEQQQQQPMASSKSKGAGKTKESPKTRKKNTTAKDETQQQRPSSRTSTASNASSSGTKQIMPSPLKDVKVTDDKRQRRKENGGGEGAKKEQTNTKNGEEEKAYNAIFQFKPQSMLHRRKLSNEEEKAGTEISAAAKSLITKKGGIKKTATEPLVRRKTSHEESPKPVPGTWERTPKERFISQNKHLIRKAASESAVHARTLARVASVRILLAAANRLNSKEDNQSVKSLQNAVKATKGSPTQAVLKMIKSITKPKQQQQQRVCAMTVLDTKLANKRSFRLGVRKTLLLKSIPPRLFAQLRCHCAQMATTTMRFNIVWKEQKKTANVTILLADWEEVVSGLIREQTTATKRLPEKTNNNNSSSPLKRIQQELDKENLLMVTSSTGRPVIIGGKGKELATKQTQQQQKVSSSNRPLPIGASLVAAAAGSITAAVAALTTGQASSAQTGILHNQQQPKQQQKVQQQKVQQPEPTTTKQPAQLSPKKLSTTKVAITPAGEVPLILPDHSVLEQFVQSNALDRLHEEAEGIIDQAKAGLQVPISSVPNTSVSLPGSKRNSQMIATAMPPTESQLPQSLSNSFHAAVQATAADLRAQQQQQQIMHQMARLRRPELSRATLSTQTLQAFEKPKSLFEDQMQRQAIHLQQKAVRQSLHEPSALERQQQQAGLNRRRSAAGDHADVAQTFVAQTQKPYQSEQRYAAHIPLSGRQSTASIESGNSSALDAASHQLDQMIDQARFKHSQQRNKFKEAIDYLDHIFEDFQREADMRQPATAKKAAPLLLQSQQRQQPSAQSGIVAVQESQQLPIEPIQATFHAPSNVKSSKEAFEKVAATIANEKKANNNGIAGAAKLKKQTSAPAKVPTISVGLPQKTEPFPVIVHPPLTTTIGGAADNQVEDIEVAETIVLPSKNTADRLDFTRNWLANGDVGTWAEGSPRRGGDQLLGQRGTMPKEEEEYDSDHSLGSCSAEVAAINAANERQQRQRLQHQQAKKPSTAKKNGTAITQHLSLKNTNSKGQQQQQPIRQRQHPTNPGPTAAIVNGGNGTTTIPLVPLPQIAAAVPTAHGGTSQQQLTKPQPYRPQPQINLMPPNFGASSQMQKVSSIEQLRPRASQERAGSQDYQSMGSSVHSQEGFRPAGTYLSTHSLQRLGIGGGTGGAFHSYTPTTMLPTHQQQPHQQQQQHQSSQNHLLKGSIQSLPDSALCTAPAGMATMRNSKYPGPTSTGGGYSHYNNNQQSHRQYSTATLGRTESQNNNQQNSQQQQNYNGKSHQHQPHLYNNNNSNNTQFKSHRQQPKQEPPTVPAHQSGSLIVVNEHALAIDALVAELELNTDSALTASEKRRSFPTMKTEVARAKATTQIEGKNDEEAGDDTSSERRRQNKRGTAEMTTTNGHINGSSMATRGGSGSGELQRKQSIGSGNRPFETINQERLNPSKVDAMARMFDKSGGNGTGSGAVGRQATAQISFTSGGRNDPPSNSSWNRKAATTGRIPFNQRISSSSQQQSQNDYESGVSSASGGASAITATSISHQNGCTNRSQMQLRQPQPPHHHQRQDPHHASSYNSRQQHQSSPQIVRGTRAGTKTSINNRIAPVIVVERHHVNGNGDDDDDDLCNGNGNNNKNGCGLLYDNIQQQRHYTRPSPGYYTGDDSASLSSQTGGSAVLPPSATSNGKGGGSRIGQLIRKLGNVGQGKPPISAASMVSLHQVSNEPMGNGRNGGATVGNGAFDGPSLTKSNSLSGEPWKSQILEQQYGTIYGGEKDMIDEDKLQHSGGIGNRLKQTIFGGMVRRRVPT